MSSGFSHKRAEQKMQEKIVPAKGARVQSSEISLEFVSELASKETRQTTVLSRGQIFGNEGMNAFSLLLVFIIFLHLFLFCLCFIVLFFFLAQLIHRLIRFCEFLRIKGVEQVFYQFFFYSFKVKMKVFILISGLDFAFFFGVAKFFQN